MSNRTGVKLLLPERRKDLWLGIPKTHVKPDWGKVAFGRGGAEFRIDACRTGLGSNCLWPKEETTFDCGSPRHMSNETGIKLLLLDRDKDVGFGAPIHTSNRIG